jgi:CPA2 family monovalent cation:H+ antiporter-2
MVKIPTKNERLFPGDEICVIGTDAQVKIQDLFASTRI